MTTIDTYIPRTGRLVTEDGRYINEAEIAELSNDSYSPFNEVKVVERTKVFSLTSTFPLSVFRDVYSGTVVHDVDEYRLEPGSYLETVRSGIYIPGYAANVGIGFRFNQQAGAEADWGYYDNLDGIFFRYRTATGYQLVIKRDGVETTINRADWNTDKLDGTGPSGINIDANSGYVFEIDYTWYGYGPISWSILDKGQVSGKKSRVYTIHTQSIEQTTSLRNPNLPIRADNVGTVGNCHISGRQYSLLGKFTPEQRLTGLTSNLVTVGTSWVPLVSFRKKAGSFGGIVADSFTLFNSGTVLVEVQLILNPVLNSETIATLPNRSAIETAVEYNVSATSFTGGEAFYSDIVPPAGNGNSGPSSRERALGEPIPRTYWVTLIARTVTGTADVRAHLRARELW